MSAYANPITIIEVIQAIEAQQFFTYVAISDEVTCPRCLNFDQGSMTRTEARETFPFLIQYTPTMWLPMTHPNCFLEGTQVWTNQGLKAIEDIYYGDMVLTHRGIFKKVIDIHRNKYVGKTITLNDVTATPNHRFLTDKGWRRLNDFNGMEQIFSVKVKNEPTQTIKKRNLRKILLNFLRRIMKVSTINLNRYFRFRQSKINIEFTNSKPRYNFYFRILKNLQKNTFKFRWFKMCLNTQSAFTQQHIGFRCTAYFIMKRFNLVNSLLWRHLLPLQDFGFGLSSNMSSASKQPQTNRATCNTKMFSNSIFAHSRLIQPDNIIIGNIFHIQTPTIIYNDNIFNGYVYNLSVEQDESYCVGEQGIPVHNCRCILYFEEEDMPRPDALTDPQLIKKVEDELIQKYKVRSVVADDPVNRDILSQFKDLPREMQIKVIRQEAMRNTKNLDPQDLMDDEDTWDLVALGVLDSLKKRNMERAKILDRLRGEDK